VPLDRGHGSEIALSFPRFSVSSLGETRSERSWKFRIALRTLNFKQKNTKDRFHYRTDLL